MPYVPPLNQIAFSVVDLRRTEQWFREGFGLLPAGGSRLMMRGPLPARVQGLPNAASTCWWLVGRNPWFQLELFQFERPLARLMPHDFRPCDIGYTRVGLWVADFEAALARLEHLGTRPLAAPIGDRGRRRACVRNPDGVYVEIMEDDPLPSPVGDGRESCPAAIRSVTLSVPDLDRSVAFFGGAIGIKEAKTPLHAPEHEALWGLPGAATRSRVFEVGDVLVELVQYVDPVGKAWPSDYRISDQGILNIAFGARNKRDLMEVYQRTVEAGARPNHAPIHLPGAGVVYVNDAQRFSVELLWMKPGKSDRDWGFESLPIAKRPSPDNRRIERSVRIAAPIESVWSVIADHEGMAAWCGFDQVKLTREGVPPGNGYGAERWLHGRLGTALEQIVAWNPPHGYRYRVIDGSPLVCHQGEVQLTPAGNETELRWTVRFRPKIPGSGALLQRVLGNALGRVVNETLRSYAERRQRA